MIGAMAQGGPAMDLHYSIGEALGTDYFGLREPFTVEQESYLVRTREFVDAEVLPVINGYWERAEFPWPLIEKMSALGIVGDGIEGYGCPPMDPLSAGLVNMEINRGDGSLGTFLAVQAGLAMKAIAKCGSEEQKERWRVQLTAPSTAVRPDWPQEEHHAHPRRILVRHVGQGQGRHRRRGGAAYP